MNILPKKRWHVRTKENVARVRRDEAKATEKEQIKQARAQKAETEARIDYLRQQARTKYDGRVDTSNLTGTCTVTLEHVNVFADLEKDTNEAIGRKNWYEELPVRLTDKDNSIELEIKKKTLHDPIHDMKKYLSMMGNISSEKNVKTELIDVKKHHYDSNNSDDETKGKHSDKGSKKHKKKSKKYKKEKSDLSVEFSSKCKSVTHLKKLRSERLLREQKEKLRTEALFAKLQKNPSPLVPLEEVHKPSIKQKYNSQFFPEIARQNAERTPRS
ncbi:hypothetical protein KPH14_012700 [Odynerus spinipes]|uniref:CBF1-interacting co-repressor CIR N-terminal domain-containing protein n=1 Tax=Odynerus spinipes TaxID=1348599 RepID=A0AAD9VKC8_9HYME|nr:hypothetical protein KPH14_012700 [Odynerus spinipes]